jgi:hypothetical protein
MIFRPSDCHSGGRGGSREYEASEMRKLIKKSCVLLSLSVAFQFFGCLGSGVTRDFLIDGVKHVGFEFLLDNNGIMDLFVDS